MGKSWNVCIVNEVRLSEEEVGDILGHRRSEHGADVDGHVEKTESRIPLGFIFRVIIKVSDEHLQVAFEKPGTQGDESQRSEHQDFSGDIGTCRD